MNQGLVSIIIPCYNGQEFLERTLLSVLQQTYKKWECILIDDGSTDNSGPIFSCYAKNDPRFKYFRQENRGPAGARNTGIELARGDFIQFLDADDLLLENKIEVSLTHLLRIPSVLSAVYSDYVFYKPGHGYFRQLPARFPIEDALRSFLFHWDLSFLIPVHAFLFRKSVFENERFRESLGSHAEDVDCWIRIAHRGVRFEYIDEVLVVYRISGTSITADGAALISTMLQVITRYSSDPRFAFLNCDFIRAMQHWRQRLSIALFMNREFRRGLSLMAAEWKKSAWLMRMKMLSWFLLMLFFSKESIARLRALVLRNTPLRWGGWKKYQEWTPPESLQKVIIS